MSGPPRPNRPAYLALLPDFLFLQDEVKARYIGKAWLLSLFGSVMLALVAAALAPAATQPQIPMTGLKTLALVVLVAPFIETLLMILPLLGLNRLFGPGPAAIGSAILWGIAHGLQAPVWGLVIWWPFLVMSIAFLTWRERGLPTAVFMVTAIHALQNSIPALLLLLSPS